MTDELSIEALKQQFGNQEIRTISTWSNGKEIVYQGVNLDQILSKFGFDSAKIEVLAENGYSSEIPRSMVSTYQPILALEGDGVPLDFSTRGPIALIWPRSEFPAELGETTRRNVDLVCQCYPTDRLSIYDNASG